MSIARTAQVAFTKTHLCVYGYTILKNALKYCLQVFKIHITVHDAGTPQA